ncbi:hypothetical protein [Streptomyces sp. NPDC053560]|uniref:hypothetical protein n=1 Tax=Streptomyces sp. NPDC053560 TaxID=3365711 RepID=UPI0037CE5796
MSVDLSAVDFTPYGPDRFAEHLPFGRSGYLFTVLGSFPDDTPRHTNVTDWEMAVYRTGASGKQRWEVRDINGRRRVWGEDGTRRGAVGLAFAEIARKRRARAADIRDRRVNLLGLQPDPPYIVEVTAAVHLVLTPQGIGRLTRIQPDSEPGQAASWRVADVLTGEERTVDAYGRLDLPEVRTGVLHAECGCDPDGDVARFENAEDATAHAQEHLTAYWDCPRTA